MTIKGMEVMLEITNSNRRGSFSAESETSHPHVGNSLRRHSFSQGDKCQLHKEVKDITNTSFCLKRSNAISDLALSWCDDKLSNLAKIEYNNSEIKDIDAKNYVYCGSAKTLPVNNLGMTLDNEGYLTLIKGKSSGLLTGIVRKYTSGYKYETAKLINGADNKKFKELYMDDDGYLIGNEKGTGKSYIINISSAECNNGDGQYVKLSFEECSQNINCDNLTFKINKDLSVSYFMQDNKFFLKEIKKGDNLTDYSIMHNEIKIPINSSYSISSIKRVMGILQVEMSKGDKKRIFYIDPKYISNHTLSVDKISHKPPQDFSSRLGSDPHEKYHAGQPFTSDRKGNFSSKSIPLFSSIVDKFRVNVKRAKKSSIDGSKKEAITHIAKAIDPLVSGIKYTVSGLIKSMLKNSRGDVNTKLALYDKHVDMLESNWRHLSKVVNESLGVDKKQQLSESLVNLSNQMKPREAIHLTSANRVAAFFGVAAGGKPFIFGGVGWFAGIVGELSNGHNLTMAKTENGNIRLLFKNRDKIAATGLVGSGQGLESVLLGTDNLDFMTVMPFEANAILAVQSTSGNDFSFEMTKENFEEFAKQFSAAPKESAINQLFITEAEAEKIKEKEFVFKIEAKSEARLQVGKMVNNSTYMVMPRTAVGARLALDLLNAKQSQSESAGKRQNDFVRSKDNLKITTLNYDAALYRESKIMPIAMHGGGDDILFCYPLPLLEEGKTLAHRTTQKPLALLDKSLNSDAPAISNNSFSTVTNINDVKNTPMYITRDGTPEVKKKDRIKFLATQDETIGIANDILIQLRKSLSGQERSSLDKTCTINVISHYEPIISPSLPSSEVMDNSSPESQKSDNTIPQSYRLKKQEFYRKSELQHKEATVPMPILNFSSTHGVSYDQFLGEIEFQYHSASDRLPENIKRRLNTLY